MIRCETLWLGRERVWMLTSQAERIKAFWENAHGENGRSEIDKESDE